MKKHIVAILAIIAVITALITVSALSNEEGYKVSPCDAIDVIAQYPVVSNFISPQNSEGFI